MEGQEMDLFMSVWTFAHVAPLDSPTNIFALQNESLLPQVLASLCGHPGPKMWCLGNRSSCGSGKSTGGRRLGIEKHTHTHITHQNCHQRPAERWWYDIICDNALISLVLTSDPCCLSCPFSVFSTAMARRRLRFQAISTYLKWLAQNWRKNTKGFEAELVRWNVYMAARLHAEMASLVSTRHPHIHTHMQTCACTLNSNVWHTHTHSNTPLFKCM